MYFRGRFYGFRNLLTMEEGIGHRARLDAADRDPDRLRRIRALYYGLIGHVDDGVACIMAVLRELRLD